MNKRSVRVFARKENFAAVSGKTDAGFKSGGNRQRRKNIVDFSGKSLSFFNRILGRLVRFDFSFFFVAQTRIVTQIFQLARVLENLAQFFFFGSCSGNDFGS